MFFIFSLAGASSIIGRFNLYELEVSLLNAQDIFANKNSSYTLKLYNPSEDRDSFSLECSNEDSYVFVNQLKALQAQNIHLEFTPKKRGSTPLPLFKLGCHFPLPHEILFKMIDLHHQVIVYPEPKGESLDSYTSKHLSYIGEFDDFEGIRSFKEGESLGLIYWPSLAKGQELMAKEFTLLEKTRHLNFDFIKAGVDNEQRLSQLCLWAIECEKRKIAYTMHFPSTSLNSQSRSHHEILQFLALF